MSRPPWLTDAALEAAEAERLAIARLIDERVRANRYSGKARGSVGAEIETAVHRELAILLARVLAGEHWSCDLPEEP